MPEIISSHLTHFYWALVCLAVALLVHHAPQIKVWWAAKKAAAEVEAKKAKALAELAGRDFESYLMRARQVALGDIEALEDRFKVLEAKVNAQVLADEAKAAGAIPALAPIACQVLNAALPPTLEPIATAVESVAAGAAPVLARVLGAESVAPVVPLG
jgi:hypothetical protein